MPITQPDTFERAYIAFIDAYPWKKTEFPTYLQWLNSDQEDARIFRLAWARGRMDERQQRNNKDAANKPPKAG